MMTMHDRKTINVGMSHAIHCSKIDNITLRIGCYVAHSGLYQMIKIAIMAGIAASGQNAM